MNWRYYSLAAKKFYADDGFLHASALTFYTLFAVVPIMATAFGIAKGFGLEDFLNTQLEKIFPSQETIVSFLSSYAQNLLAQSSGGIIAGVALLVLFYSVYSMLNHIEQTINDIWQVPKSRSITLRVNHYLALILSAPLILIVAGSLKLYIAKQMQELNLVLSFSSNVMSLALIIVFFTWLYQYVPNTKVNTKAAFFGGVQTGIAYTIVQSILVESQILMNSYGPVYGSFAAFPIFLLWVQTSWIIVLYGAQLCFVFQNDIAYDWQMNVNSLSINARQEWLLKIARLCINNFKLNHPPLNINEIAQELKLPTCTLQIFLAQLVAADILLETKAITDHVHSYLPAKNTDLLQDQAIITALNNQGITETY